MKLTLLIGSQPRHLFLALRVIEKFPNANVIIMAREDMTPQPPAEASMHDAELFRQHFELRRFTEEKTFGSVTIPQIRDRAPVSLISPDQLNTSNLADALIRTKSDVCIVFGADLIKDPVLSALPLQTFNVHLGLSPWYRGSATLFWPFYFMEPQWAGVTVHKLIKEVDAGGIVFQTTPVLSRGLGIHDVACGAVLGATDELLRMLDAIKYGKNLKLTKQRSTGRIFRMRDFRPVHLRVNYELFHDRMVDSWLDGELTGVAPSPTPLAYD